MADKRKNNGGHSTKAKGIDKRKNKYQSLLEEAATTEEIIKVLAILKKEALSGDFQSIKLFLEYYLGKPKETIAHEIADSIKKPIEFVSSNK